MSRITDLMEWEIVGIPCSGAEILAGMALLAVGAIAFIVWIRPAVRSLMWLVGGWR